MPVTTTTDDVIVAGGGPAGATAARLLATWGHRVSLLSRPPTRHALAESLPPSGVHVLGRIGVQDRHIAGDSAVELMQRRQPIGSTRQLIRQRCDL